MKFRRTTVLVSALLAGALLAPVAAQAKDVCLSDDFGGAYILRKVKALKKPGQASPLTGLYLSPAGSAYPLAGTAIVRNDLSLQVGLLVHATSAPAGNTFTADWNADATFAGSGTYDGDGTYDAIGPIAFTVVDCGTLTIP
jgi:hypothetical protein